MNFDPLEVLEVLEVTEILEKAATHDGPYYFEYQEPDGSISRKKVSREEYLDFYIEYAIETIYELFEEEQTKGVAHNGK